MKRFLTLLLTFMMMCAGATGAMADAAMGGANGRGGMGGGKTDKSTDAVLQAILAEVQPKFETRSYIDVETGITMEYNLFIPDDYSAEQDYPLLMFIPDASLVGKSAEATLTQGYGGVIWATAEEQAKHPCFVFIPIFTDTVVNDNFETSVQIEVAVRMLSSLMEEYSIDSNRLYTTGQSMGCMTSFHLNITHPGLFAASLYVGGQWDISIMDALEDDRFFYIVAAGDPKASIGQAELKELFDADGAPYASAEWSAADSAENQDAATTALLAQGQNANFVTFTLGSTLADGQSSGGNAGEHMTSFDYAYKIEAVRDWLFEQSLSQ